MKPIFYRSSYNHFADLHLLYGAKIVRVSKLLRLLRPNKSMLV